MGDREFCNIFLVSLASFGWLWAALRPLWAALFALGIFLNLMKTGHHFGSKGGSSLKDADTIKLFGIHMRVLRSDVMKC